MERQEGGWVDEILNLKHPAELLEELEEEQHLRDLIEQVKKELGADHRGWQKMAEIAVVCALLLMQALLRCHQVGVPKCGQRRQRVLEMLHCG